MAYCLSFQKQIDFPMFTPTYNRLFLAPNHKKYAKKTRFELNSFLYTSLTSYYFRKMLEAVNTQWDYNLGYI